MKLGEKFIDLYFDHGIYSDVLDLQWEKVNTQFTRTEKLMIYILQKRSRMNMGQLSSTFNIPNSTTNFLIRKLKKNGIVKTEKSLEDKRIIEVTLTAKGEETAVEILSNIDQRLNSIVNRITDYLDKRMTSEEMETIKKAIMYFK